MSRAIEVEAPRGSRVLVVTAPDDFALTDSEGKELLNQLEHQFAAASVTGIWPVIIILNDGWTVRWLETEQ